MPLPEKALIDWIRGLVGLDLMDLKKRNAARRSQRMGSALVAGIGDDCAVLRPRPGQDLLVTTDFSLEDIHFRRDWHSPESVGHRCLARGLSDIAAMGGKPLAVFLSLAVPRSLPQSWVDKFLRGLIALAEKHGATLAGGDTAESPDGVLADIVVIGSAGKGKAILRSGARAGDRIYVSGELGGSARAIRQMEEQPKKKSNARDYPRHFFPEPRLELGRILRAKSIAITMIDTSDGLSTDLAHICEESGVGAEVDAAMIPRAKVGNPPQEVDLQLALHGGEDYELLFTARPNKRIPNRIAGVPITEIGRIMRAKKMILRESNSTVPLKPQGWEHFRR